ncbi:MAG: orotate phosphoribosyltransferase [Candidatus Altiarchaeales archaeon HGW-Altiarchaeales-2]|nr:MAG: orotate phosphoribosyltransferase [Candidatus Altiarchaeales archaeon HGW-Altiarchaeales-2]
MEAQKKKRLIELIREKALVINTGEKFKLASGKESPFYFNMKPVALDPEGANLIAEGMLEIIMAQCKETDYVGGMETGGIPLVAAICVKSQYPGKPLQGFFVRKEEKKRGTRKLIEGNLKENSNVVLVEDVTTTGMSVLKAVNAVREFNCKVIRVITIVDRLEGAKENLAKEGITLISLLTVDAFKENLTG